MNHKFWNNDTHPMIRVSFNFFFSWSMGEWKWGGPILPRIQCDCGRMPLNNLLHLPLWANVHKQHTIVDVMDVPFLYEINLVCCEWSHYIPHYFTEMLILIYFQYKSFKQSIIVLLNIFDSAVKKYLIQILLYISCSCQLSITTKFNHTSSKKLNQI